MMQSTINDIYECEEDKKDIQLFGNKFGMLLEPATYGDVLSLHTELLTFSETRCQLDQ